jgi:hypothetical protein
MLHRLLRASSFAVSVGTLVLLAPSIVACSGTKASVLPLLPTSSISAQLPTAINQQQIPLASLTPSHLRFFEHCVVGSRRCYGTTRGAATLTNVGTAPLHVARITVSRGFTVSSDCPPTLRSGQHCTISVTWDPLSGSGLRRLDVYDDAKNSPQHVYLIAFVTFCPPSCP